MGLIKAIKTIIFFIICFICLSGTGFSGWTGPTVVIEGVWGTADNQFGLDSGGTFDEYPSLDGILGNGNIVISDLVNKRTLIFNSQGVFKEKETWREQPAEKGMIRYVHNKYLLGCCVQGYDSNGNLWTGGDNKYALTDKDGVLIKTSTTRPLELGVILETSLGEGKYRYEVQYPERTYSFISLNFLDTIVKDSKDYLNAIAKVDSSEEYWTYQVNKYSVCGKRLGQLKLPTTRFEPQVVERQKYGVVERKEKVIVEYGQPVVAPNGDVYTWKRTPDKYSILKWTWKDDPNVPTGPDAPSGLSVAASINGLYLTWTASPNDPGCVTGYEVARATSAGGVFSTVATVEKSVVKYNDTSAEAGTTYYYKVRAKAGTELSPYTTEVSGKR